MREGSHEATGKRVARSGRIKYFLQRKCPRPEDRFPVEHQHAVLAALDDECLRSHIHDFTCSAYQIRLIGKHSGFAVIDDENLDVGEGSTHGMRFTMNPALDCC